MYVRMTGHELHIYQDGSGARPDPNVVLGTRVPCIVVL